MFMNTFIHVKFVSKNTCFLIVEVTRLLALISFIASLFYFMNFISHQISIHWQRKTLKFIYSAKAEHFKNCAHQFFVQEAFYKGAKHLKPCFFGRY